jgi:hypothetical protein
MRRLFNRYSLLAVLALIAIALVAPAAQAQGYYYRPVAYGNGRAFPVVQNIYPPFQPTFLQRSALQNWAYTNRVIGNTYAQYPPWVFGYNPYPPLYAGVYSSGGPGFVTPPPVYNPYPVGFGAYNPFTIPANPAALSFNPYAVP